VTVLAPIALLALATLATELEGGVVLAGGATTVARTKTLCRRRDSGADVLDFRADVLAT
jgi:hypothetical protein